jgi:hypothetical protein
MYLRVCVRVCVNGHDDNYGNAEIKAAKSGAAFALRALIYSRLGRNEGSIG